MNKFKRKQNERPQAFWGALIGAGASLVGGLLGNNAAKKQAKLMANQNDYNIALQDAQSATNAYNAALDYQQNYLQQFKQQARFGGIKRLGGRNIMITDGGNAKRIGNNTYLLRGGSHEDINETGQTGIGINVGGNEIEAEGGEVAQRKGNSLRIYSAQPILGGISPAEAIMKGYNKDKVFNAQQKFKKNNNIKDDGSKARNGGYYDWAKNTSANLGISFIDPTYDYRAYYNSITPYERNLIRFAPQGTHFTDIGKTTKHPTFSNESKYSNKKTPGGTWNENVFVPAIWQFGNNGNAKRNKYMKGSGEGYFDGRKNVYPKRFGGLTSKDRGSSKHPYPSVSSKDFAGSNRSYPIPTKADAIDALRLAGLHGRSDVRSKVYSKYPELRKKAGFGDFVKGTWNFLKQPRTMIDNMVALAIANQIYNPYSATNKKKGKYGGGKSFSGAGAGGTWTNVKPATRKFNNFNDAYDDAVNRGATTFKFGNKLYNTKAEGNPIREINNRAVGSYRDTTMVNDRGKEYGVDFGPIKGPATMIPLVYDTHDRRKHNLGGRPKAEKGMLAPIYSYGTDKRRLPSFAPIDVTPRAIPNFKPVSATNAKTPFNPNSVPFLGRQSSFKPATQDYIGLGIDTLAALGSGLINYNSASKTYLPERTSIIQASKLPTYYNISPQIEEIRRQRNKAFDDISHNTSSSVAAINRMNRIGIDSALGIDKLYATKENEENKMLTQDALNQQQVAAENAKLQADYEANKANMLNAQNQAKADAINLSLSGLSQAWSNFAGSVEQRYNTRQNEAIIAATAKDPAVLSNAVQFGYNFSPEVLAAIYNSTDDDNLKSLALSQLSTKNRLRYSIR